MSKLICVNKNGLYCSEGNFYIDPWRPVDKAFEGIQKSSRHKSEVAVRFPRINRWRHDLKIEDADSIESIYAMLNFERVL